MAKVRIDPEKAFSYLKKWHAILTERGCYAKEKGKKL
jgi:hypothetical protein